MKPLIVIEASIRSNASPEEIYAVLSDVRTHLEWGGKQAPKDDFKLLTMDAPEGRLGVGASWRSTGANIGHSEFRDVSTVSQAVPGRVFTFETDSELHRRHAKTWKVQFVHRYQIEHDGTITYTCDVLPINYHPWWLKPGMRAMTKRNLPRYMRKHLQNLANLVEAASPRPSAASTSPM